MYFVPEGQHDSSQVRSAWVSIQKDPVPEGRSKPLSVPQTFVVDTELMPLQKREVFLLKSSGPMVFDLILDVMNCFWQLGDTILKAPLYARWYTRPRSVQSSRWDGAIFLITPGTSCLATISLSLRDKSRSALERLALS